MRSPITIPYLVKELNELGESSKLAEDSSTWDIQFNAFK